MTSAHYINHPAKLDTPALMVYPEIVKRNISKAIANAGGAAQLRPHVKTHKLREVSELLMDAGISKFKCATIAEAEMLALAGAKDILLAYQPGHVKAERLLNLARHYPDIIFGCLIDNKASAKMLTGVFAETPIGYWIDVNVGMNRTGIAAGDCMSLVEYLSESHGALPAGLHAYDGHIHDTDLATRFERTAPILETLRTLLEIFRNRYHTELLLVAGGTPTFPCYAKHPEIQTSPGTFVFWDAGYQRMLPDMDFEIAAVLLTRVISVVSSTTICLDLGHKSVAAEGPLPRVYFADHPDAKVVAQSEEHLVVALPDTSAVRVGDEWYGVPQHICPTVALYDSVAVVENGELTGSWDVIARDRKINY